MKTFIIAAGLATLIGGTAMAQTATTATTTAPGATNSAIVVLPPAQAGAARAHYVLDDLDGKNIYGVNNEVVGEIEDFIVGTDGKIAAALVEVGGFLGMGEKEVLVSWEALNIVVENNDVRITAPTLTKEQLESAADIDVNTMVIKRD
ncbi:PRC-barrel domain-containing protein [Rhizobium sp. CFBP 8762]|uniref:PRC-barrel domain-containing protein n=1 Tax=Rhizobium sp. CFBP 8762 TaxID=2775279 RepID=UPI001780B128|nr:PRC-barrel domain-containing protein [Rhizobium sp. CFBP 8762]MBD8556701.1 PRC-barrel domain-containing protein [Rhizobium sp. CFBP 8762]